MKFWKKFGWFMLGLTPMVTVFLWQILVSGVGMFIYSFIAGMQASQTGAEIVYDDLIEGFLSGTPYAIVMFVTYIGYLVIFGLWYWLMYCRKKQTGAWKQVLKPQRIGGIIGCGFAVQVTLSLALTIILPLFPKAMDSYMSVMEGLENESVFMILCVCLLAPICEELIFRGLTMRTMEKAFPWQAALIIQAVLFGVYHMNLVQGIYAMLLGLLFGYIAHRYGSIVPGILLHMAVNSFSYVIGYILPESLEEHTGIMIAIAMVGLAATIGFYILLLKGVKPQSKLDAVSEAKVQSIPAN